MYGVCLNVGESDVVFHIRICKWTVHKTNNNKGKRGFQFKYNLTYNTWIILNIRINYTDARCFGLNLNLHKIIPRQELLDFQHNCPQNLDRVNIISRPYNRREISICEQKIFYK